MKCDLITTRLCALAAHYGMCALLWNNRIRLLRQVLFSTNVVFTCTRSIPHSITLFMLERERDSMGKTTSPHLCTYLFPDIYIASYAIKSPSFVLTHAYFFCGCGHWFICKQKAPTMCKKNPNFVLTCVHTLLFWTWTLHFIWKYNAPSKFLDLDKSNKCVHTLLYFLVFRVRRTHSFIFLYLGLCPA